MNSNPNQLNSFSPSKAEIHEGNMSDQINVIEQRIGKDSGIEDGHLTLDSVPIIENVAIHGNLKGDLVGLIGAGADQQVGIFRVTTNDESVQQDVRYGIFRCRYEESNDQKSVTALTNQDGVLPGGIMSTNTVYEFGRENAQNGLIDESDMSVSRLHFTVENTATGVHVVDANSTNGTRLTYAEKTTPWYDQYVDSDDEITAPSPLAQARRDAALNSYESHDGANEVLQDHEHIEQVAQKAGEISIKEVVIVEEIEIQPSVTEVRDEPTHEEVEVQSGNSSENQDYKHSAERNNEDIVNVNVKQSPEENDREDSLLREFKDLWKIGPDDDMDRVSQRLDQQIMDLRQISHGLGRFQQDTAVNLKGIFRNLREGRGAGHLNATTHEEMLRFFEDKTGLARKMQAMDVLRLPVGIARKIEDLQRGTKQFERAYREFSDGHDPRRGRLRVNMDAISPLERYLAGVEVKNNDIKNELAKMQNFQEQLTRRGILARQEAKDGDAQQYRSEQIQEWVEKIKKAGVSDDDLEKMTEEMERSVILESGMEDDPNSPNKWFAHRIRNNTEKARQSNGAESQKTTSARYVAEIMRDIVRGKFDLSKIAEGDDIVIRKDGSVELGQHRTAALAMLYGNDNWKNQAANLGLKVRAR